MLVRMLQENKARSSFSSKPRIVLGGAVDRSDFTSDVVIHIPLRETTFFSNIRGLSM